MRILLWLALAGVLLAGLAGLAFTFGFVLSARSALDTPSNLQISVADAGKGFLIPGAYKSRTNPVQTSPDILAAGRRIYTARCSVCHGSDGKATAVTGANMFPRAADLTVQRTQGKSDGELFWLTENGLPHTGMPGWKNVLSEQEIWQVVTYIRELPKGVPQAAADTATPAAVAAAPATSAPTSPTAVPASPTPLPPTAAPTTVPTSAPTAAAQPTSAPAAAPTSAPPAPPTATRVPPTAVPPTTAPPRPAAAATVTISDYAYAPEAITVAPGTRIVWTNKDADVHTVTSVGNNLFDSGEFGTDGTFTFTFSQPGEYNYYCVPHDYMKGKVIVR